MNVLLLKTLGLTELMMLQDVKFVRQKNLQGDVFSSCKIKFKSGRGITKNCV